MDNKVKKIVMHMINHRGITKHYIASVSNVEYTNFTKWTSNKYDFNENNLIKIENFIKKYYFVSSLKEVETMFNI